MNRQQKERMIARRVKGGHNEAQSVDLLADLLRRHRGGNLATALFYNSFVSQGEAGQIAKGA